MGNIVEECRSTGGGRAPTMAKIVCYRNIFFCADGVWLIHRFSSMATNCACVMVNKPTEIWLCPLNLTDRYMNIGF